MAKDSIMQYIEIKDGKIIGHFSSKVLPKDKNRDLRAVESFTGMVGTPVDQIDESGRLLTKEEIIVKGILSPGENETVVFSGVGYEVKSDYREKDFWDKETGQKIKFQIGQEPDDTMTAVVREDYESKWTGSKWEVDDEVLSRRAKQKRDSLLFQTDFVMMPDYPATNKAEFESYRQALRDVPSQKGFPKTIDWPVKPEVK